MTPKQEKFVLARIHSYEERIAALENLLHMRDGDTDPLSVDSNRVNEQISDGKG